MRADTGGVAGLVFMHTKTPNNALKKIFGNITPKEHKMAGTPILQKMITDIKKAGGHEKIFEQIANGRTIASISKDFGISRSFLSTYLNRPETQSALRIAQRSGASAKADEALEIADNVEVDTASISKAREQISVRKWMASAMDPDRFNTTRSQQNVQVNIGAQHLDALRKVQVDEK